MKKITDRLILEKKKEFIEGLKKQAIDQGSSSLFYKAVEMFKDAERPPTWDLSSLYPSCDDAEIAEEVATFFNKISSEFKPISRQEFGQCEEWILDREEVTDLLKK